MSTVSIDGNTLKKMIISGANALDQYKEAVDALNVFPVPDGDTGTNMSLTFLAAAGEAEKLSAANVYEIAKAVSSGSLRGARGNSGVILSQLFRGFARGLEGCECATADDLSNAFIKASETAYKAVMKPKEGTILTIAKAMAEKASDMSFDTDDVEELLREVIKHGNAVLKQTPEMLPALRQAGVVDAGGYGLLIIWQAALNSFHDASEVRVTSPSPVKGNAYAALNTIATGDIKFAYCTEFFICTKNADEKTEIEFKKYLDTMGDSIVVVADDDVIKVHVHTNHPGQVLEKALTIGYLENMKIENMKIQHTNKINFSGGSQPAPEGQGGFMGGLSQSVPGDREEEKEVGFIVVSSGSGFKELFENLGADIVIEGGQTMNPSTEDFIAAINRINADHVIIMPNNKNIILAAEQAAQFLKANPQDNVSDKKVFILPTRSIPQGVSALVNYTVNADVQENFNEMQEIIQTVNSGQVTYAVRDTVIDGKEIREGDFLCMYNGDIELVAKDLQQGSKELLEIMIARGGEVLSIFYGEGVDYDACNELLTYVNQNFPEIEAEVRYGGQPIYHYIFSIE